MPTFARLLEELKDAKTALYHRRARLRIIENRTGAPTVIYAANTRQVLAVDQTALTEEDQACFVDLLDDVQGDRVNIVLHSPGGSAEAAEMIVGLLRPRFAHVGFIIPHMAKSAATLLALSGNQLYMDERSELGPIDPQLRVLHPSGQWMQIPAQAIEQGFERAKAEIMKDRQQLLAYAPLLDKCELYLLEMCRNHTALAKELAAKWLAQYMLADREDGDEKARTIAEAFASHEVHKTHGRPIGLEQAQALELEVQDTRKDPELRAAIWELYCAVEIHFERVPHVGKLFETAGDVSLSRGRMELRIAQGPLPQGQPVSPEAAPPQKQARAFPPPGKKKRK